MNLGDFAMNSAQQVIERQCLHHLFSRLIIIPRCPHKKKGDKHQTVLSYTIHPITRNPHLHSIFNDISITSSVYHHDVPIFYTLWQSNRAILKISEQLMEISSWKKCLYILAGFSMAMSDCQRVYMFNGHATGTDLSEVPIPYMFGLFFRAM